MRKLCVTISAAILAITVTPAQAQDWEGDVPPGRTFVCDEGSNTSPFIQVVLPYNDMGDAYLMLESEAITMAPVPVASGFGYDVMLPAGHFLVQGKNNDVTLYVDNKAPKTCYMPGPSGGSEMVSDTGYVSEMGNYSLGGKLRAGPGTGYDQVGSLPYGTKIKIVRRTEVSMDGYDWFQIEWGTNRAFQWGGIICSNALHIMGIYEECPSDLN